MSGLIDINTVIRMLNTMDRYTSTELTLCDTDKTFPKNEVFVVDDVYEGLDELPTIELEPKWISCSERLPEEYGNYLITTHDGNVDIGTIDPKKKNVWSACDSDGFYWIGEVLAWMPLPSAYREGGD